MSLSELVVRDIMAALDRYSEALHEIAAFEVRDDSDAYLDVYRLRDIARAALMATPGGAEGVPPRKEKEET